MVEIIFLGTGGAFSSGQRTNLSLLFTAGGFCALAEATPVVMHQLTQAGRKPIDVDALFVSHLHGDHVLGFPMLALGRLDDPTPLHVYASAKTTDVLRGLWAQVYPDLDRRRVSLAWHPLPDAEPARVQVAERCLLSTTVVPHPPDVPTLAMRWDFGSASVVLITDTVPSSAAVELARGSDLMVHEASLSAVLQPEYDPALYFHSSAQQAGEIARQAGCPRLALVHMGPTIGDRPEVLVEEARAGSDLEVFVPDDNDHLSL